jgi:site-specific DNA recombinase
MAVPRSTVRCAIYTRKSTEDGLEQEFNSLDAQRESAEAYVASQQHEGWACLPDHYDDGGYTGGNLDRPAMKRLLTDIESGRIDCVVVYKVDRLSRSLLDFARMMEVFDRHRVAFVSVTQQFNTATPMGRLILNVLLSFAQFERELISERVRDKMSAARRKGRYAGGPPVLGYDAVDTKLVVNPEEAAHVRAIFGLYQDHEGLIPVVQELLRRGWRNKEWTTKKGRRLGGRPFTKTGLHRLLSNPVYAGRVCHRGEVFPGLHPAIIDPEAFDAVQTKLGQNGHNGGTTVRNKYGALLKGRLDCRACRQPMTHTYSSKGTRRYRYYVCRQAQKQGCSTCPTGRIPAAEIERFLVDQIRAIGRDPGLVAETLAQARAQADERITALGSEQRTLDRDLRRAHSELGRQPPLAHLADLQDRVRTCERRQTEIREELLGLERGRVSEADVRAALGDFDPLWAELAPREQARLVRLLVQRVEYDGRDGRIALTFHPTGIKALLEERA